MNLKTDIIQTIKIIILALVLTVGVNYVFAWTGPTQGPPNGNVSAPINVGTTNQVKDAGLGINALSVFGDGYLSGNFGIGAVATSTKLFVNGGIKFGYDDGGCDSNKAGTMRFDDTSNVMEYCDGIDWIGFSTESAASGVITWFDPPTQILDDTSLTQGVYETLTIPQAPANSVVVLGAHARISTNRDEFYLFLRKKGSVASNEILGLNFLNNISPDHVYVQAMVQVDENSQIEYKVEDSPLWLKLDLLGYMSSN